MEYFWNSWASARKDILLELIRQETGTRRALFLTMITTFGLNRNMHAVSLVQNELTMDVLFEA